MSTESILDLLKNKHRYIGPVRVDLDKEIELKYQDTQFYKEELDKVTAKYTEAK